MPFSFHLNNSLYHLQFNNTIISNDDSPISSILGRNGVGKSTLCNALNSILCHNEINTKKQEQLTQNFSCFSNKSTKNLSLKQYDAIYINDYTEESNGILLPKNISEYIEYNNFTNQLSYTNINSSCHYFFVSNNEEVILGKKYNLLEASLYNIIPISITSEIFSEKVFAYNSTSVQAHTGQFGLTHRVHNLSFSIEYLSSFIEISIKDFLHLMQNKSFEEFKIFIWEKICPSFFNSSDNIKLLNTIFSNLKIVHKNQLFYDIFFGYEKFTLANNDTIINTIKNNNKEIEQYFPIAKKIFGKFFIGKFKDISLNKRFSSSLDCYVYDFLIIDNLGKKFYSFDFTNNISSEGEKRLLNMIHLIIKLISLPKKHSTLDYKYLITADDAFSSFDNANLHNILSMLKECLANKSCIFINFTHDYEFFRIFNNKLNIYRGNMHLLNRAKNSNILTLLNHPIKSDFYSDYIKSLNPINVEEQLIIILSIIPQYRNTMDLLYGKSHQNYLDPTYVLHLKPDSLQKLLSLINNKPLFTDLSFIKNLQKRHCITTYINSYHNYLKLMDDLFNYYQNHISNNNKELLQYRIFLSIYSRVIIESWIINFLSQYNLNYNIHNITKNQTSELIVHF